MESDQSINSQYKSCASDYTRRAKQLLFICIIERLRLGKML
jgi:hypothetical protein